METFAAPVLLAVITPTLIAYGSSAWPWIGGPIAALVVWALGHQADESAANRRRATSARREEPRKPHPLV